MRTNETDKAWKESAKIRQTGMEAAMKRQPRQAPDKATASIWLEGFDAFKAFYKKGGRVEKCPTRENQ